MCPLNYDLTQMSNVPPLKQWIWIKCAWKCNVIPRFFVKISICPLKTMISNQVCPLCPLITWNWKDLKTCVKCLLNVLKCVKCMLNVHGRQHSLYLIYAFLSRLYAFWGVILAKIWWEGVRKILKNRAPVALSRDLNGFKLKLLTYPPRCVL